MYLDDESGTARGVAKAAKASDFIEKSYWEPSSTVKWLVFLINLPHIYHKKVVSLEGRYEAVARLKYIQTGELASIKGTLMSISPVICSVS